MSIDVLRHVLVVLLVALVSRWMWKSSLTEKATPESGRLVFPPALPIRIFVWLFGPVLAGLVLLTSYRHSQDEWWVPLAFLAFFTLLPLMYPPVLVIDLDGVECKSRFGRDKKIAWHDVASLHYNRGNKQFKIRSSDGRGITHAGFNVDPEVFRDEVQKRTRLPMKVSRPGTWRVETIEVPYEPE